MLLILIALCIQTAAAELVHVQVIFRHGDRTPVLIYPNDIHQESAWPRGLGQLTNIGMNQHFNLGQYLRKRYDGLLQKTYNVTEIYVRSSDVDRTLMSAESNLAGLYFPEVPKDQFHPGLKWNPVPIHTVPEKEDSVINGGQTCPRADQLLDQRMAKPDVQEVSKKNAAFLVMLKTKTGMPVVNLSNEWSIVDCIICERAHNMSIPDWVNSSVWTTLRQLDTYVWDLRTSTQELRRLRGGVLLYQVLDHIQALSRPDPASFKKGSKMIIFSGHDYTVSDLMSSAHMNNGLMPPYAAAVLVELHRINGKYSVQFFYRNDSTRDPYPLTVKGCSHSCPVDTLVKLLSSETLHPNEYSGACTVVPEQFDVNYLSRDLSYSVAFLCIAGVVCVLAIITISVIRKTKSRYRQYRRMNSMLGEEGNI